MALLDLVNELRDLLREGRVTSTAGAAPDLLVQKNLVNRAARRVLARRAWSFLQRTDGQLYFPARVEVSAGTFTSTMGFVTSLTAAQVAAFGDGTHAVKLVRPDDSAFPNTSYYLSDLDSNGINATLVHVWRGDTGFAKSHTIYSNEARLPSTVANVLSLVNEEGIPVKFETMDTFDDFDRRFPQEAERFAERPDFVAVGGQVVPTSLSGGSVTRGVGVRFWPPNDQDVLLRYSYVRRVDTLTDDTDELTGVPQEVQDHIVSVAYQEANAGSIEDDPDKAQSLRVENGLAYRELAAADRRDVGRRHIPTPFGSVQWPNGRRCVTDGTIPSP